MAYFEWGDDLSVNDAGIDRDHRRLIDLVNELHTATRHGDGRDVVGGIIDALIAYAGAHFQREEQHMERMGYSGYEEHKRKHQVLLAAVLDMQSRLESGYLTVAAQLSALLRDWLSVHIRREDKAFAATVRKRA